MSAKEPHTQPQHTNNTNTCAVANNFKARRFHLVLNPGEIPKGLSQYIVLFNKYTKLMKYLTYTKDVRYIISGLGLNLEEHNNMHLLHIHIYIEYKEVTRLYISKVYGAHIMNKIDNSTGLIEYVKSQELGTIEEIGKAAKSANLTIREAKLLSVEELQDLNIKYTNIVKNLILEKNNDMDIDESYKGDKLKVYYIYGPTGCGKSKKAKEMIKSFGYKKYDEIEREGNFYIGVTGKNKACLYDDFRPSDMKVSNFIKFIDYNIHNLNVKGGSFKNIYELIIITSVNDPHHIYNNCTDNEETKGQWLRRMELIEIKPKLHS